MHLFYLNTFLWLFQVQNAKRETFKLYFFSFKRKIHIKFELTFNKKKNGTNL
jgi:hypothetical protein